MAAAQNTQIVALQLEKVRKKLPLLYERTDALFSKIQKREVMKVSSRNARIPLQTKPGGAFGYANFDGGDLGRGSLTNYDVAQLTPLGLKFAVEINKLLEYVSNSSEKAVADATKLEVANAMKQFRRDLDAQLMTAGSGVVATVSSVASLVITVASTPFGARLVRPGMKLKAYTDSTLGTPVTTGGGDSAGTMTVTDVQSALGATQTITVDATATGLAANYVLVPDGLTGANPVGLYGIPYHHNSSATGTWLTVNRSNSYTQAAMINANSSAFAMPFARLAIDSIMQNIGPDETEALKQLKWLGNRAQRAAMHELAFAMSTIDKKGADQSFDLGFKGETLLGIETLWNIHADPTRLDLLNLDTWGRVEWKEIDYLEIGGDTVFPVYGTSGGIAAAYLFYLVAGMQFFIDNPKAVSGITGLALPTGY